MAGGNGRNKKKDKKKTKKPVQTNKLSLLASGGNGRKKGA